MEAIWTSLLYDIIWIFRNMNWVQTISITIHHHEWNWGYNPFSHSSAYHSLHSPLNMSLWKCLFIATFSLVAHCKSNAQDDTTERNRNAVGINAAITSSYTWQLEAAYHWFPLRYIGIGGGIGFWKQFSTETIPQGKNWKVDENYQLPSNLYLIRHWFSCHQLSYRGMIIQSAYLQSRDWYSESHTKKCVSIFVQTTSTSRTPINISATTKASGSFTMSELASRPE